MSEICLIACSATKAKMTCCARDLYQGDLFRKSLRWAEASQRFDEIFILSAMYGLVKRGDVLSPYDASLARMRPQERAQWARDVAGRLRRAVDVGRALPHEVVLLAGKDYADDLSVALQLTLPSVGVSRPLAGLGIGQQKAWLKRNMVN